MTMSGDYSRDSFDALRDYAATYLQQGRPVTDADWNEMVRSLTRRIRAGTVDTIGRAVVPRETPLGFQIEPGGGTLGIGRGRLYLSGMLMECHGRAAGFPRVPAAAPAPVLDRARQTAGQPTGVLDEPISAATADFLPYAEQPYWPVPAPLPTGGRHLAYLVGWEREVTALHDPDLLEPALGGIDTTTRIQHAWQVRVAPVNQNALCATAANALGIPGWEGEIAPSTARLTTGTIDIDDPEDPCLIPPTDGYTGLENQLYRVELHSVGANQTAARFKFSRENASVIAAVEAIDTAAGRMTVSRIGRDRLLAFREGDWVELTDDRRELDHRSGAMLRVAVVHQETREIEFEGTIPADLIPGGGSDTPAARHSRLIRWDQRGVIRREDGTAWTDLDAATSDGLIPVPPAGTRLVLESGIVVGFDTAPAPGRFREMDYWRFWARTAGTQIQILTQAPPDGIHRHYTRLAILDMPATRVDDCRVFWPPEVTPGEAGDCCACTVCVTPESHASGALTIQAAIDSLPPAGGTVCLDGGLYELREPVRIQGKIAVALRGQGAFTVLNYQGSGGALQIRSSIDVVIDRLSVLARSGDSPTNVPPPAAGIQVVHSALVALTRIVTLATGAGSHGIALAGLCLGSRVSDCLVSAPVALGAMLDQSADIDPNFLIAAETSVAGCILIGGVHGIRIEGLALNLSPARFECNLVLGLDTGATVSWLELPSVSTAIEGNTLVGGILDALRVSGALTRVQDNQVSGGAEAGNGVRILPGLVPELTQDAQIIGNRIADLAESGIRVEAVMDSLLVKRNLIRRCGAAGITITPDAAVRWLAVDNNVIEEIALTRDPGFGLVGYRIAAGRVAGNTIRAIGPAEQAEGNYLGIALRGTGQITVESNHLSGIGTGTGKAHVTGIAIRRPYAAVAIRANQIEGAPFLAELATGWGAIEIGALVDGGFNPSTTLTQATGSAPFFPGFSDSFVLATIGEQAFAVSPARFAAVEIRIEPQITVSGNQIRHGSPANRPLVSVADGLRCSTILSENHVRLDRPGEVNAIAVVECERIACANNVIRRGSEQRAVILSIGRTGRATVLGNITFGNIELVPPPGLVPPFRDLNLVSP
jgi:hypothetical protein